MRGCRHGPLRDPVARIMPAPWTFREARPSLPFDTLDRPIAERHIHVAVIRLAQRFNVQIGRIQLV